MDMLSVLAERLASLSDFTAEGLETMLRALADEKQVSLGKVAQPLRVAITGTTVSPPIFEAVNLLGLDRTLERIQRTIDKLQQE